MISDFHRARPLLQQGDFTKLFIEELGWEPCRQKFTFRASETNYDFTAVAEKHGFTTWLRKAFLNFTVRSFLTMMGLCEQD